MGFLKTYAAVFFLLPVLTLAGRARPQMPAANYYKAQMEALYETIQQQFYDSAAGYYKEVVHPGKEEKSFSYLWPVCAIGPF